MVSGAGKKILNDNIINILLLVSIIFGIIFISSGRLGLFGFIAFFILIIVAIQIYRLMKKYTLKSIKGILLIFIRIVPPLVFIILGWKIFLSKNYNLKYTYWIAIILLIYELLMWILSNIVKHYNQRKSENKSHNLLYAIGEMVLWILLVGFMGYNCLRPYLQARHQIVLNNLKMPKKISIYSDNSMEKCELTSPDDIEKIVKNLKSARIENYSSTDLANYNRMKLNSPTYYTVYLDYDNSNNEARTLKNGYISSITINSNRTAVINNLSKNNSFGYTSYDDEIYPINLSKDTMDMILNSGRK